MGTDTSVIRSYRSPVTGPEAGLLDERHGMDLCKNLKAEDGMPGFGPPFVGSHLCEHLGR